MMHMKQSSYVVHAATDGADESHLLYHTARGIFALLGKDAYSIYDSFHTSSSADPNNAADIADPTNAADIADPNNAAGTSDPSDPNNAVDTFNSSDPNNSIGSENTIDALIQLGFLVSDEADEIAEQYDIYRNAQQDRSSLVLCLAPTYACNLRCPYCYEKAAAASWDKMDERTESAIYDFMEAIYARDHFTELEIEWYGGEPTLVLDIVERMSDHLRSWCESHDVSYKAMMLTNATNMGTDQAELLARCDISEVLITIDGFEETHNKRRPTVDGRNSYRAIMEAIPAMQAQDIEIHAISNVDKVTAPKVQELQEMLAREYGINLMPALLNDYHQEYGCGAFAPPTFDLFTHEEYAEATCTKFLSEHHSSSEFKNILMPAPLFCRGQRENYFGIDARGDVYKCDGWMGDGKHVLFNLFDGYDVQTLQTAPVYPFNDEQCCTCVLLPICQGTCEWERECCGYPHYPLINFVDDYLRAWHISIKEEGQCPESISDDAVVVLSR